VTTVLYVLGTRPEAIRSARILQVLAADDQVDLTIVNTGQHYDERMLSGFLKELDVPPVDVDLGVGSGDPVSQTARVIESLGSTLRTVQPDTVVVFGDTNSTLGSAIAAVKADIPLVHVEAGCRSFDRRMPEEVNRRAIDHVSDLLLAVSEHAAENLAREHVPGEVRVVGDPLYDIFISQNGGRVASKGSTRGLITLHRQENADDPDRLAEILAGIASGAPEMTWTFPVHPRTAHALSRVPETIHITKPLLYGELLETLFASAVCVTDSGGLQKEAFWARVPCVTVRRTSEWMETVEQGANELASPESVGAAVARARLTSLSPTYENPYGDGHASESIAALLRDWRR
jgi:UDP-N-acetylglucosamine 2-epimerase